MNADEEMAEAERQGYVRGRSEKNLDAVREAEKWRTRYFDVLGKLTEILGNAGRT